MIIQIYEIQNPRDAELLVDIGVDHVGSVILSRKEWKDPVIKKTVRRVQEKGGRSALIPLFSDLDAVCRAVDYYQPDIIHFCEDIHHSDQDAVRGFIFSQGELKSKFPELGIMRSIPLPKKGEPAVLNFLELARQFEPVSDYFLTDTRVLNQPVNGFIGITGQTCDWRMAASLVRSCSIPVILAGGITPENAFDAVIRVRPAGVDSCTGTNAQGADGRPLRFQKDFNKVKTLISEVRRGGANIAKEKKEIT
ncbi:MAG: hypothetical protein A2V65_07895 [Deltaproteobacteria bacterium RBG_13_49_15]|nr:MAG: hypothetical protein A2V65_07895 [Deltaproteobacteria bacterium RBG_13_49_15]